MSIDIFSFSGFLWTISCLVLGVSAGWTVRDIKAEVDLTLAVRDRPRRRPLQT